MMTEFLEIVFIGFLSIVVVGGCVAVGLWLLKRWSGESER